MSERRREIEKEKSRKCALLITALDIKNKDARTNLGFNVVFIRKERRYMIANHILKPNLTLLEDLVLQR